MAETPKYLSDATIEELEREIKERKEIERLKQESLNEKWQTLVGDQINVISKEIDKYNDLVASARKDHIYIFSSDYPSLIADLTNAGFIEEQWQSSQRCY